MRICENGIYRDATAEEIEEYNKQQYPQVTQEPTLEERISSIEDLLLDLL